MSQNVVIGASYIHSGPSSFIMLLQKGKVPIVVPRKHEFGEHVNDHQVDFCEKVSKRQGNIIVVEVEFEKIVDELEGRSDTC